MEKQLWDLVILSSQLQSLTWQVLKITVGLNFAFFKGLGKGKVKFSQNSSYHAETHAASYILLEKVVQLENKFEVLCSRGKM